MKAYTKTVRKNRNKNIFIFIFQDLLRLKKMQVLHFLSHKNEDFFPPYANLNMHFGFFPPIVKTGDPVLPLSMCNNHFIKTFNKNKIYHIVSGRYRLPQLLNLSKSKIIGVSPSVLVCHEDIKNLPTIVIHLDHTNIMRKKSL